MREDDAAVDQDIPAGDLDALLPDLPEAEEPGDYAPGNAPAVYNPWLWLQMMSLKPFLSYLAHLNFSSRHCER